MLITGTHATLDSLNGHERSSALLFELLLYFFISVFFQINA